MGFRKNKHDATFIPPKPSAEQIRLQLEAERLTAETIVTMSDNVQSNKSNNIQAEDTIIVPIKNALKELSTKFAKKPILQFDKQGNLIKEWESVSQAAKFLNESHKKITAACKGEKEDFLGFVWKYK